MTKRMVQSFVLLKGTISGCIESKCFVFVCQLIMSTNHELMRD